MKKIFLFICLLPLTSVFAQSPGGVSANNTVWLKANTGVTPSAANLVTEWDEQSGANITGNFTTSSVNSGMAGQNQPAYVANGINFNPKISFSTAAVNSVTSGNSFSGLAMMDQYNNTLLQVIDLHTLTAASPTGVFFKWQYLNTNAERMGCETNPSSQLGKMRFDFRGLTTYSNTNIFNQFYLTNAATNNLQASIRLNGGVDVTNNFNGLAAFAPTQNSRLTLGNEEFGDPYPTTIDVAEVILFKDTLDAADKNKVESYLAVKYGFTLNQSATYANNYTSAGGSMIWNHYANLVYINNITGIGRDDASALSQNQSKSINAAGIVTVYNGAFNGSNFPVLNTNNTTPFTANNSFFLFGDNNLDTSLSICFAGDPGLVRMARVWKIEETGTIGTVTLAVGTASVPAGVKHLLVSTDSVFTPANTTIYDVVNNSGYLSQSVTLPANGFFTFASDSLIMHASATGAVCSGTVMLFGTATPPGATFQWTGPNSFTSTQQNPVIPNAVNADSGAYILSGTYNGCPAYPDTIDVIVIATAPPAVVTPVTYCQGDAAISLTGNATGQSLLWYTNPPTGAGSATAPTPSTAIPGTTAYYVSQTINGCQSDSVAVNVIVKPKPNLVFNISDTQLCLFNTTTLTYTGDAATTSTYNWTLPANAILTSGSITSAGPLVMSFNTPGIAQINFNVTDNGCTSNDTTLDIDVIQSPPPVINFSPDICIGLPDFISFTATADSSNSIYFWSFSGASDSSGSGAGPYNVVWNTVGTYTVFLSVTVSGCASVTTPAEITVHPLPDVQIAPLSENNICIGDSLLFAASTSAVPVYAYQWMPTAYFLVNNLSSVYGIVDTPGYISVRAISDYGCLNTDSVFVNTHPCCDIELPNAFTPNNDGKNDIFRIISMQPQKIVDFRIVDRWGQVIYTATDNHGWDGTFNGIPQGIGTYFYTITYVCADDKEYQKKGDIVLIR